MMVVVALSAPHPASAECPPGYTCEQGCESTGQCVGGKTCTLTSIPPSYESVLKPDGAPCGAGTGSALVGKVRLPFGVTQYNSYSGSVGNIGVLAFANSLIILFFSICVVWFMFNLIHVGLQYLASPGDTKVLEKLKEALFYPTAGLVLLASSYVIAALIGAFVFGDSSFILNPTLPTVTQQQGTE